MFTKKVYVNLNAITLHKLSRLRVIQKSYQSRLYSTKRLEKSMIIRQPFMEEELEKSSENAFEGLYRGISDSRIIFSTYIHKHTININKAHKKNLAEKIQKREKEQAYENSAPLIIEKFIASSKKRIEVEKDENRAKIEDSQNSTPPNYPYSQTEEIEMRYSTHDTPEEEMSESLQTREEMKLRLQAYDQGLLKEPSPDLMIDNILEFEEFEEENEVDRLIKSYEADPNIPASNVPCSGCGAHLHCQEPALPGFVSKDQFANKSPVRLRGVLCQRCFFVKHFNTVLQVRVSPESYPKVLEPIKANKKALAVVLIDIMDMPCSIWPNLLDILGTHRPVVIVGNKVDLLPRDDKNYIEQVKKSMMALVNESSLGRANIKYIALVSAHTGYGIENLITVIQNKWGTKGDVYLLGCTNSGKSTLFNTLLGSDMCKTRASFLIPSATVSPWPGTTLNMLKFPVLRPSDARRFARSQRLSDELKLQPKKKVIEVTKSSLRATPTGMVGRSFTVERDEIEKPDPFSLSVERGRNIEEKEVGIDDSSPYYKHGKWCYDTPGTIQPDQMINILTHDELMNVLPRHCIMPETFCLHSGHTLFIGGLARLDLIYSPISIRFTVFRSKHVPVTIVDTVDAAAFYRSYLGSDLLGVPTGNEQRLQSWPPLKPVDYRVYCKGANQSCADVVLSSAGWVALTGTRSKGDLLNAVVEVRGWTPEGRGCYLRHTPILPKAVTLRGPRIDHSVAHKAHGILVEK